MYDASLTRIVLRCSMYGWYAHHRIGEGNVVVQLRRLRVVMRVVMRVVRRVCTPLVRGEGEM